MVEYFGSVAWENEDIENAFDCLDYECTPDDVAEIRDRVRIKIADIMTAAGWDCIYNAIHNYMSEKEAIDRRAKEELH